MITTTRHQLSDRQNEVFSLSKFVVLENFKHHADNVLPNHIQDEIDAIYQEELLYSDNSQIFIFRSAPGGILGTIRSLKWDYTQPLPIQKMFGIDPVKFSNGSPDSEIWHIGRFAIKKGMRDILLLKELMVNAIAPICQDSQNIAFAECDAKLLRIMRMMGIKAEVIGESIDYLGSETIPVCFPYSGLIDFYNENKYLMSSPKARLSCTIGSMAKSPAASA